MTAHIFLTVVCLLALKYTLEVAGATRPIHRTVVDELRRRAAALQNSWFLVSTGVLLAWTGVISDRAGAGAMIAAGIALSQVGVFRLGATRERSRVR
jgi:hypothetical protein